MNEKQTTPDSLRAMLQQMGIWEPIVKSRGFVPKILVVDDDPNQAQDLALWMQQDGHQVDVVTSAEAALQAFIHKTYHVVLLDAGLPGFSAAQLIRLLQQYCAGCNIILLTNPTMTWEWLSTGIEAIKPVSWITRPVQPQILRRQTYELLHKSPSRFNNRLLSTEFSDCSTWEGMRARSQVMLDVFSKIKMLARSEATILLMGEPGSGREWAARAIHNQSRRKSGAFIKINTHLLSRSHLEKELFGSSSGEIGGKLKAASGGTLFVDEIAVLDERTQLRLLEWMELGLPARRNHSCDTRLIVATQHDLVRLVRTKTIAPALVDRLKVLQLTLPSLRERKEDIIPLAYEWLSYFCVRHHKLVGYIPEETKRLLEEYPWPNNGKELEHVIEQAVLLADTPSLEPDLLPKRFYNSINGFRSLTLPIGWTLAQVERELIFKTLELHSWNKKWTAEVLGISRRSLYNKLAAYGMLTSEETPEEAETSLTRS